MSDREAFMRKICEEPEEDAHRLVFADWLEEYGGEPKRAEFIRVQCELARLGSPHKRTAYPDEPTPLRKLGDRHYSFGGYIDDRFQVGDRIDLLVAREPKPPKWLHGLRVYKVAPRPEVYADREVDVYVRLDGESREWAGSVLAKRQDHLWNFGAPNHWAVDDPIAFPDCIRCIDEETISSARASGYSPIAIYRRGFVDHITCSGASWLKYADVVTAAHPVRRVVITSVIGWDARITQLDSITPEGLFGCSRWPKIKFELPNQERST